MMDDRTEPFTSNGGGICRRNYQTLLGLCIGLLISHAYYSRHSPVSSPTPENQLNTREKHVHFDASFLGSNDEKQEQSSNDVQDNHQNQQISNSIENEKDNHSNVTDTQQQLPPLSKQHNNIQTQNQQNHQQPTQQLQSPTPPSNVEPKSPKQNLLPKKLITVFGPESSGTTFLSTTLAIAIGAFPPEGEWTEMYLPRTTVWKYEKTVENRVVTQDGEWEIQHLSLPWGWSCQDSAEYDRQFGMEEADGIHVVEALVPQECFRYGEHPLLHPTVNAPSSQHEEELPTDTKDRKANSYDLSEEDDRTAKKCRDQVFISEENDKPDSSSTWTCGAQCGNGPDHDGQAFYPWRFFVNITSHIEWYLARGVDVTVILSMRDRTISKKGKYSGHCLDREVGEKEDELALQLMEEALQKYGKRGTSLQEGTGEGKKERAIAMSYEGLMEMKEVYLFDLYHQLGINSTFAPNFKDGNGKYVMGDNVKKDSNKLRGRS